MTGVTAASSTPSTPPAAPSDDLAAVAARVAVGDAAPQALFDTFLAAKVYCQRPERPGFLTAGEPPDALVPVFSSLAELAAFAGECDWFSTSGEDVLSLLPEGFDLVLDPAGEHPLRLRSAAWEVRHRLHIDFRTRRTAGEEGA